MTHLQKLQLEGICLVHSWIVDARLKGDVAAEEMYLRLLTEAIEKYSKEG